MTTQFALLRHAETVWNRDKRIQGQQDAPLTSDGRKQSEKWGRALRRHKLDHLIMSDLGRAIHTADLINKSLGLPCSQEPRLREQDWGCWSGLRHDELLKLDEHKAQQHMGWHFRPAKGESRLDVFKRSYQALVDAAHRLEGQRILVITHGGVVRSLLYRMCDRDFSMKEPQLIEPYRLHWLSYDEGTLRVDKINETF